MHELNSEIIKRSHLTWNQLNHILNPSKDSADMQIVINDKKLSGRRLANCFKDYFVFLVHIYYIRSCLSGILSPQNPQTAFLFPANSNEIHCILSGHSKQVQYLQVYKKLTRCTSAKEEKMYHSAVNLHICSLISSAFAQMLRQCTWKLR